MRERAYLRWRYAAILSATGVTMVLASLVVLSPLLLLIVRPGESGEAPAFIVPSLCLCVLGFLLWRGFRPVRPANLSIQEGGVVVLLGWTTVIVFSAWPLMWAAGLSFSRAVFESVSGWTTTGLSVVDVTRASPMILLWRSCMQLAGGAGLAIIMLSAIVGPTGVGVSAAEGRGDQLAPHVRKSARLVLIIYAGYAVLGTLAYRIAGMSLFDAVNHAFPAVSTGGFSSRVESIGYWDSWAIEAVTLVLMLLGNLSFVTAWFLLRGRLRAVVRNGEVRLMGVLIPTSAVIAFLFTCQRLYPHTGKAARVAIFETISALTTTGFSTVGYRDWSGTGVLVLIVLMLIGGGTCSTAGGIKQFRVYLLWKLLVWEIRRALLPRTAVMERALWEGEGYVSADDARVRQVCVFVFLYMTTYLVGSLMLCGCGSALGDSLFEMASAIGTVGLSRGVTSYSMPSVALWTETLAMFLGRLEFIVVIVSLLKLTKDGIRIVTPGP